MDGSSPDRLRLNRPEAFALAVTCACHTSPPNALLRSRSTSVALGLAPATRTVSGTSRRPESGATRTVTAGPAAPASPTPAQANKTTATARTMRIATGRHSIAVSGHIDDVGRSRPARAVPIWGLLGSRRRAPVVTSTSGPPEGRCRRRAYRDHHRHPYPAPTPEVADCLTSEYHRQHYEGQEVQPRHYPCRNCSTERDGHEHGDRPANTTLMTIITRATSSSASPSQKVTSGLARCVAAHAVAASAIPARVVHVVGAPSSGGLPRASEREPAGPNSIRNPGRRSTPARARARMSLLAVCSRGAVGS
jgi:hypothetical protein